MIKHSKRYYLLKKLINPKIYSLTESINLLKNFNTTKFNETIESHITINNKYKNQLINISNNILLPYYTNKIPKIAVFIEPENFNSILNLGADIVGFNDLIKQIENKIFNFDYLLTTPKLMSKLAKLGRILGSKNLMPSTKTGTITTDFNSIIKKLKQGTFNYKTDKFGCIHLPCGTLTLSETHIKENILTFIKSIFNSKPNFFKGNFIKSFYICTTMSPSLKIDLTTIF